MMLQKKRQFKKITPLKLSRTKEASLRELRTFTKKRIEENQQMEVASKIAIHSLQNTTLYKQNVR